VVTLHLKVKGMSTVQIRSQLHQYIDRLDDRFLNAMFAMVQQYVDNEEVIGNDSHGNPLTKMQLQEEVTAAYQQHQEGKTHSQNDVLAKIESW
jgi:hypothetical protein